MESNCLFYKNRIVIPESFKPRALKLLHTNHDGIVRTKLLARSLFWWPSITKDIENLVKNCQICDKTQKVPTEKVLYSWPPTERPFQRVHVDFFFFEGQTFLLIVDTFSKFIDAKLMRGTSLVKVIDVLVGLFKYFGMFQEIVSDNGPPFNSYQYEEFAKLNGIKILKSPVYHPQSNGQAEKSVDILKTKLNKYLLENRLNRGTVSSKLDILLMCYNNTPSSVTLKTPLSMVLSYRPTTFIVPDIKLEVVESIQKCKPKVSFDDKKNVVIKYNKNKSIMAQNLEHNEKNFKKGEKVMYRNHFKNVVKWIPAIILEKISPIRYKILIENFVRIVHKNQIRYLNNHDLYPEPSNICKRNEQIRKRKIEDKDVIQVRRSVRRKREPLRFAFDYNFKPNC